jgi:folylpolyglutamate synthase
MVAVRERIRINGKPIPEPMFAKYFFQVWDKLEHNTTVSTKSQTRPGGYRILPLTLQRANPDTPLMPAYFRYLTIMAFHVFLQEKVRASPSRRLDRSNDTAHTGRRYYT